MKNPDSDPLQSSRSQGSASRRLEPPSDFELAGDTSVSDFDANSFEDDAATHGFDFGANIFEADTATAGTQVDSNFVPTDLDTVLDDQVDPAPTVPQGQPGTRGFRARWRAKSRPQNDNQPFDDAHRLTSDAKRQKLHRDAVGDAIDIHETVETKQLHNIARLASLEAMQRFRTHDIKMPWEKGPLAPVFGAPAPALPTAKTLTPPMVGLVDTLAPTVLDRQDSPGPVGPISKFAIKRIAAAKCVVPEDEMLARCLNQIKSLLLMDLQGTEVGITLCNLAGGLDESADVLQILRDCFARKATATILKRTSSLWTLAGWMVENEQTNVWTMTEQQLYRFMCALRDEDAAPTKASHLVEALNFFDNALKFKKVVCKDILSSRVLGAAHSMYLGKRKLKQAPQLSVAAVRALEIVCTSQTSLLRTAVSGALLFCVFAVARWSDFARLENVWTDKCEDLVLVEAETARHKTSKSKEAKTRLLPFTAIGRFECEEAWGECFVDALDSIKHDTGLPFLPSWNDRSGTWATSPMTTAEASLFLKEFVDTVLGDKEASRYSSHSCKPTVLTWCGMTEVLTREECTMLGHHVEPSTKSATTYNRDSQLLLQAKVAKVLDMITAGQLEPDASRATRLSKMMPHTEDNLEVEEVSAESDFEDTEGDSIHSKNHLSSRPSVPLGAPDEYQFVEHKLAGTIHVVQDESSDKLACGRRKTINMRPVEPDAIDAATAPFCIQCNAVVKHHQP